ASRAASCRAASAASAARCSAVFPVGSGALVLTLQAPSARLAESASARMRAGAESAKELLRESDGRLSRVDARGVKPHGPACLWHGGLSVLFLEAGRFAAPSSHARVP